MATSFEQHHHPHTRSSTPTPTGRWSLWTLSETTCLLVFTGPLIAGPLMSLGHSLVIYFELILRTLSLQKHMVLVASQNLVQKSLLSLLIWPLAVALLSALPMMSTFHQAICYRPWSITYWYIIIAIMSSLTVSLLLAWLVYMAKRR